MIEEALKFGEDVLLAQFELRAEMVGVIVEGYVVLSDRTD